MIGLKRFFKNHFGIFLIITRPESKMLPWEHFAKETLKEAAKEKARIQEFSMLEGRNPWAGWPAAFGCC